MRCQTCHAETTPTSLECGVCATPTGAPAIVPGARTYAVRGVGIAASVLVGLVVLLDVLLAFWPLVGGAMAKRAMRELDPDVLNAASLVEALAQVAYLVPFVAAVVLVIVWCYRARANLDAFPGATTTLSKGWAIAGWLVPFANLFIPVRMMAGIARDSLWRSTTPALVRIWFGGWLLYLFIGQRVTISDTQNWRALPSTLADASDYQLYVDYYSAALGPNLLVALLGAVAGAALILLILRVSTAQQTRIGRNAPAVPVMPGMPVASA
ncbi:DUF4328 domain-containing protein [Micromonospora sp. NPDC050417]|uniref:DUF4328 domain-containing protein n=1 Tax=Micromonospora sp. NPDC050417 TaxID=3364280 RepID=UPI0037A75D0B